MRSDENHFNVSLIVRDKVTRLSINHNPFEEKELEWNRAKALLLTSLMPYCQAKLAYEDSDSQ